MRSPLLLARETVGAESTCITSPYTQGQHKGLRALLAARKWHWGLVLREQRLPRQSFGEIWAVALLE